jgi:phosphatidylserine/phosphatidylglycerophosphate/cardiolipin synthase-like enzyme
MRYDNMGNEYIDEDYEDSDDGYDSSRDAYLTGEGPAVTRRQIDEDRAWQEECRRNRW